MTHDEGAANVPVPPWCKPRGHVIAMARDAHSTRAVVRACNERIYAGIELDRQLEQCQLNSAITNNPMQGPSRVCRASNRKHLQG
jgi:hypothetical protein